MRIIDADTHVDETEDTWEYLQADEQAHKPTTGFPPNPDPSRPPARYWVVDGRRHLRFIRSDSVTFGLSPALIATFCTSDRCAAALALIS